MQQAQHSDLSRIRPVQYFDEAAAYNAEHPENPSHDTEFLRRDLHALGEVDRDGNLRSTSEGDPNSFHVLTRDESDYCLTVERLVWIDGWRNTSTSQNNREAMTLLVLNLTFENKRGKKKIATALAELVFLSDDYQSENPEVVAWGPFRHEDRWNASMGELKTNDKGSLQLAAGMSGGQATISKERGKEMSQQVIDFDQGVATRFYSATRDRVKPGDKPNAVRWQLKQNDLQRQGVNPELRIAVLVSRPSPTQSYRVSFRLEAGTGTMESIRNMAQSISRRPIGDQINWMTNPSDHKPNNGQGVYIAKMIDRENLGNLIRDPADSENLDEPWLKPWKHMDLVQLVQASESGEVEPAGDNKITSDGGEVAGTDVQFEQFSGSVRGGPTEGYTELKRGVSGELEPENVGKASWASTSGNGRHNMLQSDKPRYQEGASCCRLSHGTYQEYDRVLGLEVRAAQAEARIASQDQIIFQLQKEMLALQKAVSGNASYT